MRASPRPAGRTAPPGGAERSGSCPGRRRLWKALPPTIAVTAVAYALVGFAVEGTLPWPLSSLGSIVQSVGCASLDLAWWPFGGADGGPLGAGHRLTFLLAAGLVLLVAGLVGRRGWWTLLAGVLLLLAVGALPAAGLVVCLPVVALWGRFEGQAGRNELTTSSFLESETAWAVARSALLLLAVVVLFHRIETYPGTHSQYAPWAWGELVTLLLDHC